jgi:hypothetical protein
MNTIKFLTYQEADLMNMKYREATAYLMGQY